MFFTQEDYKKIEHWLYTRGVKDSQFPNAHSLDGSEDVPILQDSKNKKMNINDFIYHIASSGIQDVFNASPSREHFYVTLEEAVNSIPLGNRKPGLIVTFLNEDGYWLIYQFHGTSTDQWTSMNLWSSPLMEAVESLVFYPDEEDITGVRDGNRTFLKFKNRDYNPEEFIGMGMVILRRNEVGIDACPVIGAERQYKNILTQDMINKENTVYIVEYDFDLDGKTISIPKGCTLWFQGGKINNGNINLQETAILGAFEFADTGNSKLFGKFNTGQIMTFHNDSYKQKEGGYFIASEKESSATSTEDPKQDKEVFYDKNPNAYVDSERQELRWWNGEEWILILDITDYNEIVSIINDLVDKHNAEMSACYKYFKARCYALEVRMDEAEKRLDQCEDRLDEAENRLDNAESEINNIHNDITNIQGDISNIQGDITNLGDSITNLGDNINNITGDITNITNDLSSALEEINKILDIINNFGDIIGDIDQIIQKQIEEYLSTHTLGVASVTVNGTKYTPDSTGNITLPDYPEVQQGGGTADKVANKLIFDGAVSAEYDGSKEVRVTIPEGSTGGGIADSVKGTLTLRSDGTTLGTYNGSTDKTIDIPTGGNGGNTYITAKEPLTVKYGTTTLDTYTGETAKTITIPNNAASADKLNKKLKFTGAVTAEYDGSSETTVNIPAGSGDSEYADEAGKVSNKLIFTGNVPEGTEYDGSKEVVVNIPNAGSEGITDPKTLKVVKAGETDGIEYNTKEDKQIDIQDLEIIKLTGETEKYNPLNKDKFSLNLPNLLYGNSEHPVAVFAATFERANSTTNWVISKFRYPKDIITNISIQQPRETSTLKIIISTRKNVNAVVALAIPFRTDKTSVFSTYDNGNIRTFGTWIMANITYTTMGNVDVSLIGFLKNNTKQDSGKRNTLSVIRDGGDFCLGFSLVVFGHVNPNDLE